MAGNKSLREASMAKKDEFYTQLSDIANELKHYKDHFKDKVVLCNCDDPYESNFTKYFMMMFNEWGLKKLICTCWDGSIITGTELNLFNEGPTEDGRSRVAYKLELTKIEDLTGDGVATLEDVQLYLQEHKPTRLQGNGDFRSQECIELLKEADIVVTNPPFSLFREYVAQLVEYDKKFLIIGNINSLMCKEIFPLIKENKMWIGVSMDGRNHYFRVPNDYELTEKTGKVENNVKYAFVKGTLWYTNLDHKKRHYPIDLYKHYTPEEYTHYDNFDAIDVSKVAEIPMDYDGIMGVPVSFLNKFCPEQFELISVGTGEMAASIGVKKNYRGRTDIAYTKNGKPSCPYGRILIRKKQ